jgi:hypothetical protein
MSKRNQRLLYKEQHSVIERTYNEAYEEGYRSGMNHRDQPASSGDLRGK